MADVAVDMEIDEQGGPLACVKISSAEWEVNVRARQHEFDALTAIRATDWSIRRTIAMGTTAGSPVFWACDGGNTSILIGSDDEVWDVAVWIPVEVVDRIVALVRDL